MTALQAIEDEAFAGDSPTVFTFADLEFAVAPVRKWRSSAHAALRAGDFELWASKVFVDGTYETGWQQLDPDLDEINDLIAAWSKASGADLGKSQGSSTSSRSTRKR